MFLLTDYSYSFVMKNLIFPKELIFPKVQCISKNVVSEGIKKELIHALQRNKTLTRASCSILVSESFCMIYLFAVRLNRNGY